MKPLNKLTRFLLGSSLLAATSLHAADGTWITDGNGLWSASGNWQNGNIAGGADSTGFFTAELTGFRSITMDGNRTLGHIVFTDGTTPSNNLGISGNILTLQTTSEVPTVNSTQSGRTVGIGNIAGTQGLNKIGAGALQINFSTYTGATTISAGNLILLNNEALQNSYINTTDSVTGTTTAGLKVTNGSALYIGGLSGNKDLQSIFDTDDGRYASMTAITLNTAAAYDISYSGAIAGSRSLTKSGDGTQTLAGTNTYSGATSVSAGTLYVTGALSDSAVTVAANGTLGSNGGAGARTLGNGLTIEAGGNLDLTGATLGAMSSDILSLTGGSLTLGNLTFQDLLGWNWATAEADTYQLIDGGSSIDWGSTAYLDEESAYVFGNGNKGYFTFSGGLNAVIIPEPSEALLGAIGLLALLRRRR